MKLYNHVVFKMGKHEAEIAPHIPEGGNWQDIPLSISDTRLDKIREDGLLITAGCAGTSQAIRLPLISIG